MAKHCIQVVVSINEVHLYMIFPVLSLGRDNDRIIPVSINFHEIYIMSQEHFFCLACRRVPSPLSTGVEVSFISQPSRMARLGKKSIKLLRIRQSRSFYLLDRPQKLRDGIKGSIGERLIRLKDKSK